MEMLGNWPAVGEVSGKIAYRGKLFIVNLTFWDHTSVYWHSMHDVDDRNMRRSASESDSTKSGHHAL